METVTLLYVSDLAPDVRAAEVGTIVKQARANNQRHGLTGLLVFDGARFAQLVQGPADPVHELARRLGQAEPRHTRMEILLLAPLDGPLLFSEWRMGYLHLDEDSSGIEALRGQHGSAALAAFRGLVSELDLDAS